MYYLPVDIADEDTNKHSSQLPFQGLDSKLDGDIRCCRFLVLIDITVMISKVIYVLMEGRKHQSDPYRLYWQLNVFKTE